MVVSDRLQDSPVIPRTVATLGMTQANLAGDAGLAPATAAFRAQCLGCFGLSPVLANGTGIEPVGLAWCRRQKLHLHAFPHWFLRPACLLFHYDGEKMG